MDLSNCILFEYDDEGDAIMVDDIVYLTGAYDDGGDSGDEYAFLANSSVS
jgi:hypothetical protein